MGGEIQPSSAAVVPMDQGSLIQAMKAARIFPEHGEIASQVAELKKRKPSASADELSRLVIKSTMAKVTGVGIASALPAAVPGWGTAIQVGAMALIPAEVWYVLRQLTAMQLTVAALHGHDPDHPDRQDELVIIWGLETGAVVPFGAAASRIGEKVAVSQFNRHVSGQALMRINRKLGTTVLTKMGVKRGGIALGRLIPLGVGAAIGGTVNYLAAKGFGGYVRHYYSELGPDDAEVVIVG